MKERIIKIIKTFIILMGLGISFYLINNANKISMLPSKYFVLLVSILIILNLFAITTLLIKKNWTKVISAFFYSIIIGVVIFGSSILENINSFLDEGFNNNTVEVTVYSVLVKNDSAYKKIWQLNEKLLGSLEQDMQKEEYLDKLVRLSRSKLTESNNLELLYRNLVDKKMDALVIDSAYLDILEEEFPDLEKDTRAIYTFRLEKKLEKNYEKVNKLEPINIYISGSDSRNEKIETKSRSDVNMIVTINPNTKTILLTSIPRDYYVQLHGTTGLKDKLSHSGIYGTEMSKKTLEDLFQIELKYSVKLGFQGLIKIVDLVGGVDIDNDQTFNSSHIHGWIVKKGNVHMDGAHALAYARERYAYKGGDRHRILNQQQVLEAVMKKVMSDKSILKKYDKVLQSLKDFYRTDIPREVIELIVKDQLEDMSGWKVVTQTVDGSGSTGKTYTNQSPKNYIMIPYEKDVKTATEKINKVLQGKAI